MAYNPDALITQDNQIGGYQPRHWRYATVSDTDAQIIAAGYFSDGYAKGVRLNDTVGVIATTGPKYKLYQVTAVNATTKVITVSAPTAIT